jgi:hypothetical protein
VKRLLLAIGLVLVTAGCGGTTVAGNPVPTTPATAAQPPPASSTAAATVPPEPEPVRDGTCPYLPTAFVEDTNAQRVGKVRLSADQPHPACFFYRADGNEQLRVQVLIGLDPTTAKAVVDRAAPVDTSDPATLPGGWEGGKQPTDTGAVFAVARATTVVVVVTNQKQTIKASRVAEHVIAELKL